MSIGPPLELFENWDAGTYPAAPEPVDAAGDATVETEVWNVSVPALRSFCEMPR
jgi:hypothetical protein